MSDSIPGYAGKIALVDLSSARISYEEIPGRIVEKVIGGKGLGAWLLYRLVPPHVDALSPENAFIVATGPAQGVMPIAGRYTIVAKSPHTGLYLDSHAGGYVGPELKMAGLDALVVRGSSESPVWLQVEDGTVQIKPATSLWGKSTEETERALRERHDSRARVMSIGPAGERLVPISLVVSDGHRTASRGGLGALWGSKGLKAISIVGDREVSVADPSAVEELVQELRERARANRKKGHLLYRHGTSWLVNLASELDQLPVTNFQAATSEDAEKLSGYSIHESFGKRIRPKPCFKCSIACSFIIDGGFSWAEGAVQQPEYESLALLGSNLGIYDVEALLRFNHMCNVLGLDTISTGNTIGWFMESVERGVVPEQFSREFIRFGDVDGALELIRKIALREGVGALLSGGVRRASRAIGKGSEQWAVHVKGLELPAWDPRGRLGLGLSYAVTPVGGSHLRGWPTTSDIPDRPAKEVIPGLVEQQDLKILKDSLIMCHFTHSISPALSVVDTARIFSAITGVQIDEKGARKRADLIWKLTRMFNEREFVPRAPREMDVLPPRLMNDPLPSGRAKGKTSFISQEDFEESLTELYHYRGLTDDGKVPDEVKKNIKAELSL